MKYYIEWEGESKMIKILIKTSIALFIVLLKQIFPSHRKQNIARWFAVVCQDNEFTNTSCLGQA